jgi:myosin regulatory light chain 12
MAFGSWSWLIKSAGITPSKTMLDGLLSDRPGSSRSDSDPNGGINFTMFLTMMGEHLFEFDPEQDLLEAFECFDESDSGFVKVEEMKRWMADVGERMDPQEVIPLIYCILYPR